MVASKKFQNNDAKHGEEQWEVHFATSMNQCQKSVAEKGILVQKIQSVFSKNNVCQKCTEMNTTDFLLGNFKQNDANCATNCQDFRGQWDHGLGGGQNCVKCGTPL